MSEAMADDEVFAERVLEKEEQRELAGLPKPTIKVRRMVEWSAELEILTNMFDRIGDLISVTMAANGAKGFRRPPPGPRPTTSIERVRARRRERRHRDVVARMLPAERPAATPDAAAGREDHDTGRFDTRDRGGLRDRLTARMPGPSRGAETSSPPRPEGPPRGAAP